MSTWDGKSRSRRICTRCSRVARVGKTTCSRCGDEWRTAEYKANRLAVLLRDAEKPCAICGYYDEHHWGARDKWSVDHVVRRSSGGDHGMDNLRKAHLSCNSRRQ